MNKCISLEVISCVKTGDTSGTRKEVKYGVPQGTMLGAVLFSIT